MKNWAPLIIKLLGIKTSIISTHLQEVETGRKGKRRVDKDTDQSRKKD
jgi:hypothetical protein